MLNELKVLNIPLKWKDHFDATISKNPLMDAWLSRAFCLKTCQRTLYISFHQLNLISTISIQGRITLNSHYMEGESAYRFLLEIICGLKSRLTGESEIVSQFKSSYLDYIQKENRNPYIIKTLEKLFTDCKKVRSRFLKEIGQYSYSGLSKKIISRHLKLSDNKSPTITILGSGQLATDLIKVLNKKYSLSLCARNPSKLESLLNQLCATQNQKITITPWEQRNQLKTTSSIINTIGCDGVTLFDDHFLKTWDEANPKDDRVFIDLGSPSVLGQSYDTYGLYRLSDIFKTSETLGEEKKQKLSLAKLEIEQLSKRRVEKASIQFPFGWEELQFA